jgi:hypothetical protein
LFHGCVADPLANAERRAVNACGTGLEGGESVGEVEAAIAVPVPVDTDLVSNPQLVQQLADKRDQVGYTLRHDGAAGIA